MESQQGKMSQRFNAMRKEVIGCTKCQLCETRTNSVPGKGNLHADVIFVGEAPGKNEDVKGEPFVGIAGKKLSDALKDAGVSREQIYITNIVKCRPPKNRVPTTSERDACRGYLNEEIRLIRPKIICIMGNTAFGSLLGGSEITKFRGKIACRDDQLYFLSVHPAATIYNKELVKVLRDDIVKLFGVIAELKNGRQVKIDVDYTE